jgi:hypothetical protein
VRIDGQKSMTCLLSSHSPIREELKNYRQVVSVGTQAPSGLLTCQPQGSVVCSVTEPFIQMWLHCLDSQRMPPVPLHCHVPGTLQLPAP